MNRRRTLGFRTKKTWNQITWLFIPGFYKLSGKYEQDNIFPDSKWDSFDSLGWDLEIIRILGWDKGASKTPPTP